MQSLGRNGRIASASFVVLAASLYACSDAGTPDRTIAPDRAPSSAVIGASAGLIAAFAFDEASGTTTTDVSGSSNTGTLGTGVTRTTAGRFGAALTFNGGGYLTVPASSSLALSKAMTLEAWVNPSTVDASWRDVIEKGNDNYYLMVSSEPSSRPAGGGKFAGDNGAQTFGTAVAPTSAWTHLAVTYDGATIRLYANGTQVSSVARTGAILATTDPLTIGGDPVYGQYFKGVIDEVRIYNRALSAAEITTDMNTAITNTSKPQSDTVKPTIAIMSPSPTGTYTTPANTVSIAGSASDNVGVTQVTWANSAGGSGTATGTTTWSAANVALQGGTNVISVTAKDAANNVAIATITVTTSVPPTPVGLVASYGFEEPSGSTTADRSGKGNTGSLDKGVSRTTSGKFGAALSFNNGTVTIPNSASLGLTTAMTLEAWVNPSNVNNQWRDVIQKGRDNYYLMASSENASRPAAGGLFASESSTTKAYGATALATNTWTHLAVTYDGSVLRFYVNGTQTSTVARTGPLKTSTDALTLGGDPFFGQKFRGTIDEVRIYNRALSAAEIKTDMNSAVGSPVQTAPPASPGDVTPPTVAISLPQASGTYTTTATSVTLSGTATDNVGVTQVRWANSRGGSGTFSGTANWSAAIPLQSGTNAITVTAQDAANNAATATLTVVSNPPAPPKPTQLAITRQPSSSAQSGAVFAQQPVVQLRDASNAVAQAGVVVTAAIASGGGTLGGTATATTNGSGVATFTNLQITGTAGTRTLMFSATGLTSVTSTAVTVSTPVAVTVPPAGLYPNRPASFTQSYEIDFSQTPVTGGNDQVDNPIPGTTGWNMIYFGNNWSKTTDANAPQSAPGIWQGRWAAGAYGGGVIGQGGGHGIGNVFTYAASGTKRLYMSMRVYFDFDASLWHPISNKFVNIEGDKSQLLMQLRESNHWRHAEELAFSGPSFWVDGDQTPGEAHIPGQIDNRAVPNRKWTQIEVLVDLPNHIFKIWQDGVLTTNAAPTFASTQINTVGIYAYRGGGGETLSTDLYYKYDHFFIAW